MSSAATLGINSNSYEETLAIAGIVGARLKGGEVIELIGDLGSGKTAFVRGLAKGAGSTTNVQSPTFTISRIYNARSAGRQLEIHHYDFHRLDDSGVVGQELADVLGSPDVVVVVEWAQVVRDALPKQRLQIKFSTTGDNSRRLELRAEDTQHLQLIDGIDEELNTSN